MMIKALITYDNILPLSDLSNNFKSIDFVFETNNSRIHELIKDAEIFICDGKLFNSKLTDIIKINKGLKWIQMCSAGVDHVTEANLPKHIRISRGGGIRNSPVAEHVIGMLYSLLRRIHHCEDDRKNKLWKNEFHSKRVDVIEGKRVLILGFGEIGETIYYKVTALGMNAIGISTKSKKINNIKVKSINSLYSELQKSDILVMSLPKNISTNNIIGNAEINIMKKGSYIINVGRGNTLDLEAVYNALENEHLSGVALDVTEPEPLPTDHPLWTLPNVLITPHIAGESPNSTDMIYKLINTNIKFYLAGKKLKYEICCK